MGATRPASGIKAKVLTDRRVISAACEPLLGEAITSLNYKHKYHYLICTIIPEYPNLQPMRQAQQPKLRQDPKRGTWPCPYMYQEPTRCKPS